MTGAMTALLAKDILTQKMNVILGGFYSLIFFLGFGLAGSAPEGGFAYVFGGIAVGYMMLLGSFASDKNDTPRFMLSLPVTRRQAVNGKFVLLALGTVYGTVAAAIIGAAAMIPAFGMTIRWINGIDLLRIAAGMLLPSFLIPLYFRFGYLLVRYALYIVMGVLVVLQIVGMMVIALTDRGSGAFVLLDWIFDTIRNSDPIRLNLTLIAIGAATTVGSYIAAVAIYLRRDI